MSSKKASKVRNPYEKRKQINNVERGIRTSPQEHRHAPHSHRPSGNVNQHATFSQAFGDIAGTAQSNNGNLNPDNSSKQNSSVANASAGITTKEATEDLAMLQPHVLHVSTKQRGNGLLRSIRNVPFAYAKIIPDYIVGPNRCALFLSFKYHNLHPNYIHRRIAELRSDFDLRILLCLVDVEDNASILLLLNKICCINNMTLILAWSEEEAARYLETFKAFEGKDASLIQKKKEVTFAEQVADTLGCIRSVNKTDAATLISQFGNLKRVMTASIDDVLAAPGIGEKKARRLHEAFNKPFSSAIAKKRRELKENLASKVTTGEDGEAEDRIELEAMIDDSNDKKS